MEVLRRTGKPIKQVALAVGFLNEKSFARAFRQWTGDSPAEYRRKAALGLSLGQTLDDGRVPRQ
jgi:transcriptional regulator GlxA family with amidase domain